MKKELIVESFIRLKGSQEFINIKDLSEEEHRKIARQLKDNAFAAINYFPVRAG